MTLVKALTSSTRYLLHRAAIILPSWENCLWDKWDNTPNALKTVSALFVWVTKWVSKTVNKKICCPWLAGKQAFISISGGIWLLTLQCISFIHVCYNYGSETPSHYSDFFSPVWIVGLSTWHPAGHQSLSSHSSCFHDCAFKDNSFLSSK